MIDCVIGLIVLLILYNVYAAYGFVTTCVAYVVWRFISNNFPRLFGLEPMRAEDLMWLIDEPGNPMVEMGSSIVERESIEYFFEQARLSTTAKRFR